MSLAVIGLFLTSTTHAGLPLVVHRPLNRMSKFYLFIASVNNSQSFIQHTTLHVVNDNYTDNNQEKVDQSKDPEHYTT